MLTYVPPRPRQQAPFEPDQVTSEFDWSSRLSLDVIRTHTKTDDIPGVTDDQLRLYRASAIESAELYTGRLLAGQRTQIEPVQSPPKQWSMSGAKSTYPHQLRYPVADGIVYLYGGDHPEDNRPFMVPIGTRTIHVPIRSGFLDMSNCCDPCAQHLFNRGMMAAYKAGFKSPNDVPAGIVLGCLQYIAWVVEHPGDELVTQRNHRDNSTKVGGVSGSNNIAMISGALETWRLYDDEAV